MTKHAWKGRGKVTWTIYILVGTNHISGTAEARVIKFCTQADYIKDDNHPYRSVVSVMWQNISSAWLSMIDYSLVCGQGHVNRFL